MKIFVYAFLSMLLIAQIAIAGDDSCVERLLKGKLDAVLDILQNKDLELDVKKKEIVRIVTPIFDFTIMAKLSLGKRHWSDLKTSEKEEFVALFTKLLKTSYLEKLTLYKNEKISYEAPVQKRRKIHIPTILSSKENKISMIYKHYKSKQGWKIYDIEIQGISIISTYRSQFNQTLSKGTIHDLLRKLKNPEQK